MGLFDEKSYSFNTVKSVTELDTSTKELEVKTEEVKEEVQTIQSEPFSGSDPGLVPTSTTDTQAKYLRGDGSWATPEGGGGGGTSDYNDLVNKPAIDGTELDKDSTAEGLGLAKLTDIPDMKDVVHEDDLESYAKKTELPTVPTKVSELQNDSGYLTDYTETDPTVPSWAKQTNKPTYTASEVGLGNVVNTGDTPTPTSGSTAKFTAGGAYTELNKKQDKLTAGENITFSGTGNTTINAVIPAVGFMNRSDLYDTTEKVIGKWIDGRPLYQKTYTGTFPSSGSPISLFSLGGTSILVKGVEAFGLWISNENAYISIPYAFDGTKDTAIGLFTENGYMKCEIKDENTYYYGHSYYITVRYTKTTDAANSYNYADENDYSTSEKIVGTWIDGKKIYQKTFTGNMPSVSTNETFVPIGASISEVIDIQAMVKSSGGQWRRLEHCNLDNNALVRMSIGVNDNTMTSNPNSLRIYNDIWGGAVYRITLQYTKTS